MTLGDVKVGLFGKLTSEEAPFAIEGKGMDAAEGNGEPPMARFGNPRILRKIALVSYDFEHDTTNFLVARTVSSAFWKPSRTESSCVWAERASS